MKFNALYPTSILGGALVLALFGGSGCVDWTRTGPNSFHIFGHDASSASMRNTARKLCPLGYDVAGSSSSVAGGNVTLTQNRTDSYTVRTSTHEITRTTTTPTSTTVGALPSKVSHLDIVCKAPGPSPADSMDSIGGLPPGIAPGPGVQLSGRNCPADGVPSVEQARANESISQCVSAPAKLTCNRAFEMGFYSSGAERYKLGIAVDYACRFGNPHACVTLGRVLFCGGNEGGLCPARNRQIGKVYLDKACAMSPGNMCAERARVTKVCDF